MNSARGSSRLRSESHFVGLVAFLFASGCARLTQCTVENHSSALLTHIVVTGTGFSAPVPDLAPGSTAVIALHTPSEVGEVGITFEAGGREHRHSEPVYFEARGYSVLLRIGPQFEVTVQVGLAAVARASSASAPFQHAS